MHVLMIGAGVSGLTCGIALREAGYDVTIAAERRTPEVTSDRAGAVFTPFRAEGDERTRRWTRAGYEALCRLARDQGENAGLSIGPLREYCFSPQPQQPWWSDLVAGFRRLPAPPGYSDLLAADVPRMAMRRYLPWLEARFERELGGRFIAAKIRTFDDAFAIAERCAARPGGPMMVVNCAGLGARELARDDAVRPMRGQILHVENHLNLIDCILEEGRGKTSTYIFPFPDYVVLGGTYEVDEWREVTDDEALAAILERCRNLLRVDGHPEWRRLGEKPIRALAGLRPVRVRGSTAEAIRLETESIAPGRTVVHNYGHGRAGVTFSWGCAPDVVALVRQVSDSRRE